MPVRSFRLFALLCCTLFAALPLTGCSNGSNNTVTPTNGRGDLLSSTKSVTYTKAQIDATAQQYATLLGVTGLPAAQYDVDVYVVTYRTPDNSGALVTASGAMAIPRVINPSLSTVSFQHGTATSKTDVPSNPNSLQGLAAVVVFASQGYLVSAPDYLGLGQGTGLHPYLQASTEASASLDMLRATRNFARQNNLGLNGQVFLTGHSQGGHATLALQNAIQSQNNNEVNIVASAPASGPYDLSGSQLTQELTAPGASSASLAAYTLVTYNQLYSLFPNYSAAFVTPYDTTVPPLFDGLHSTDQIGAVLGGVTPAQVLQPAFVQALQTDTTNTTRLALARNNVYDFKPTAPTLLLYSKGDTTVAPQNTQVALDRMTALGGSVSATNLGDTLDHTANFGPALVAARRFFDTYRTN